MRRALTDGSTKLKTHLDQPIEVFGSNTFILYSLD